MIDTFRYSRYIKTNHRVSIFRLGLTIQRASSVSSIFLNFHLRLKLKCGPVSAVVTATDESVGRVGSSRVTQAMSRRRTGTRTTRPVSQVSQVRQVRQVGQVRARSWMWKWQGLPMAAPAPCAFVSLS